MAIIIGQILHFSCFELRKTILTGPEAYPERRQSVQVVGTIARGAPSHRVLGCRAPGGAASGMDIQG